MAHEPLPIIDVAVSSLRLDLLNYRIPSRPEDEAAALDYLVSSEEVLETAQLILRDGYFDNEFPIVIADGDEYVVLEGNRRVSALKLLLDPELAGRHQQRFERLLTRYATEVADLPTSVRVLVAPDRRAALPHVARLHTTTAKKPWTTDQQATFYFSLLDGKTTVDDIKADFPAAASRIVRLMKMASVRRFLGGVRFDNPQLHDFATDGGLTMSAFEYAYRRPELASAMGIEFDDDGFVKPADRSAQEIGAELPEPQRRAVEYMVQGFARKQFDTRSPEFKVDSEALEGLARTLRGLSEVGSTSDSEADGDGSTAAERTATSSASEPAASTAQGSHNEPRLDEPATSGDEQAVTESDSEEEATSQKEQSERPAGGVGEANAGETDHEASGAGSRRPNHPDTKATLDLSGLNFDSLPVNLKGRFYELDRIKYRDSPIATAVLMRSLLELSIKTHFADRGVRVNWMLKESFKAVVETYGKEPAMKNGIAAINSGNQAAPGSISWFNAVAHDAAFAVRSEDVLAAWKKIQALCAWLIQPAPPSSGK